MRSRQVGSATYTARALRLALLLALIVPFCVAPLHAAPGTDPTTEPIPTLDFGQGAKTMVVRLDFTGRYAVTVGSVKVSFGRAATHVGDPPLLRFQLFNDKNALVSEFNAWHPLWANLYDATGPHSRITLAAASGRFVFPFAPDLRTVKVFDIADPAHPQLIAVDLQPAIKSFCQANPQDPDCPLAPATLWVGLKNSDDQGTQFDVQVRVYHSLADPVDQPVATGLTRCVVGVTRNPALAKQVSVEFSTHVNPPYAIRVFTRVGTKADDTKCFGPGGSHNSAVGLRLYYDSADRASRVGNPLQFLHGATKTFLDAIAPVGKLTKQQDSNVVNFSRGNAWTEIGKGWSQ